MMNIHLELQVEVRDSHRFIQHIKDVHPLSSSKE